MPANATARRSLRAVLPTLLGAGSLALLAPAGVNAALEAPTASFTCSPASPTVGRAVSFDGGGSTCAAMPCTYSWTDVGSAGDQSWPLGTGPTLEFTFRNVGSKYVRLTVRDSLGQQDTELR